MAAKKKNPTDLSDLIPQEFYSGDDQPQCFTVGELIHQLSRLPPGMRLGLNEGEGVTVTVPNVSWDPFCSIDECDTRFDDDEE